MTPYMMLGSPVRSAYRMRFYWLPRRLTLHCNPAIYRWGYWNFSWEV